MDTTKLHRSNSNLMVKEFNDGNKLPRTRSEVTQNRNSLFQTEVSKLQTFQDEYQECASLGDGNCACHALSKAIPDFKGIGISDIREDLATVVSERLDYTGEYMKLSDPCELIKWLGSENEQTASDKFSKLIERFWSTSGKATATVLNNLKASMANKDTSYETQKNLLKLITLIQSKASIKDVIDTLLNQVFLAGNIQDSSEIVYLSRIIENLCALDFQLAGANIERNFASLKNDGQWISAHEIVAYLRSYGFEEAYHEDSNKKVSYLEFISKDNNSAVIKFNGSLGGRGGVGNHWSGLSRLQDPGVILLNKKGHLNPKGQIKKAPKSKPQLPPKSSHSAELSKILGAYRELGNQGGGDCA